MNLTSKISCYFICYSFSALLLNRIAFGIFLFLGISLLIFQNKNIFISSIQNLNLKKFPPIFLFSTFFISTTNSFLIERSALVYLYLLVFMFFGFSLFCILKRKPLIHKSILKNLFYSLAINIIIIFCYDLFKTIQLQPHNSSKIIFQEIIRFKGILNIFSLLICIFPILIKSKVSYLPIILLIPVLIMSNCNSAILGIIFGMLGILLYLVSLRFLRKTIILAISFSGIFLTLFILNNLPYDYDNKSVKNFNYKIPTTLIDAHRQYIWSFSIKEFKKNWLIGIGPDTANFIEGSQKTIGLLNAEDMPFIPSHPHNFIIELLLETGVLGTFSFILFIFWINFKLYKRAFFRERVLLVFTNFYFWSASLVNFSFWLGWWQGSYYFILAIIASTIFIKNNQQTN